jgi:oxygen-dependent protoporphyrinogen oxidase
MRSVAIIGAGITGLTAAFTLQRAGRPVRVYEASPRVGGVIRSERRDGFLAEFGPNTILETSPRIGQLVRDAGLAGRRLEADPKAAARYLVRHRRPVPVPTGPLDFLTTALFSLRAKLAVLREPFVRPRRDGTEESIAQFVERRLDREFLERAVDALVAGIYAGDSHALSVAHAFPRLKALEDDYGSLIRGQLFGARARRRRGEIARDRAPKFSFDEGVQVLPDGLAAQLGDAVTLNAPVRRLTPTSSGWEVSTGAGAATEHAAVVFCGSAPSLAELQVDGTSVTEISRIRYAPVASVVLGLARRNVTHPCAGFGVLIPRVEGFRILGTIFSSSLFPGRAPADHLTLTSYIGGERSPELAALPAERLYEIVRDDLRELLGVRGAPVFQSCAFYSQAIPQYNVGYGTFKERMASVEAEAPGLFFAGHYRDGVSLGDCIVSGLRVADRVAATSRT